MKYWPLILALLSVFIIFSPVLNTYFSQDDWVFLSHTYKQPFIKIFDHHLDVFYRPVGQQLFFWIGSGLFGLDAGGFHFLGILVHLLNIILLWKLFRYFPAEQGPASRDKILSNTKLFLLLFYAVNPAHFVALNWLTQVDLEIAVSFALASIYLLRSDLSVRQGQTLLDVAKKTGALLLFLFGILSHEVVVFLPVVWWVWFKQKRMAVLGLISGLSLIGAKFLANPFSSNADYTVSTNISGILSTLKWYGLRALFIPEGVRNFPYWITIGSLITPVLLILIFRQKIIKGMLFYFLGILPVLGFGSHLLAAYAIFGIALMVIELSSSRACREIQRSDLDRPDSVGARFLGFARNDTIYLLMLVLILSSMIFIHFNYSNHWSTTRGIVSQRLTSEYFISGVERRPEILARAENFKENHEIYFSSMMGRQYEVLDRGGRGIIDFLFYRSNDMTTQFLPDAQYFKDNIISGKFPVWNPWIMAGMPYLLDPQNFLWYPPNYLLLLMPLELGFFILLIGHLLFAGLFVRKVSDTLQDTLQKNNWVGWLGAGMFMFSPKLIGHIEEGNWSLVIAASWLPMLYWSLKNKRFNWLAISLSAIIINNLNIGYYSLLFTILFFILIKRSNLAKARLDLKILKTFVAVILLTIPRWLPLVLFGNQTVRANLQEAPLPFWSWIKIMKSLFFPLAGGHPVLQNEEVLYVGIIPVLLITVYLLFKGPALLRQGRALFWFVWLTFISLVALNVKTPIYFLIKLLPGFSLLRITTRPWIFMSLALALAVPMIVKQIREIGEIRGIRVNRKIVNTVIGVLSGLILAEFIWFDWKIFVRREIVLDKVPIGFYQIMASSGKSVRAYCTTGCLDRLTAQKMGIAVLGGNNPVQLTSFVNYLQKVGGYTETGYFPILPPYTVFNQQPQPNAEELAKTATKFIVSPYELKDDNLELVDQEGKFRLYRNDAKMIQFKDHYFELY